MACPEADQTRAHIAEALAHYPNIDAHTVEQIKTWFNKDASALEVALLASDPAITDAYRKFCADHVDRFSLADLARAALFVLTVALVIAAVVWRAL